MYEIISLINIIMWMDGNKDEWMDGDKDGWMEICLFRINYQQTIISIPIL